MKKSLKNYLLAVVLAIGSGSAMSQTANFTNTSGGDWNVAANWDLDGLGINVVPAEATNALINSVGAVTVNYNAPMAATSFGGLIVDGGATLNINAAGFNQNLGGGGTAPLALGAGVVNVGSAGVWTATNGGALAINSGGTLNISGTAYIAPVAATAPVNIAAGGSLNVLSGGSLTVADGGINTITGSLGVTNGSLVISNSGTLTIAPGASIGVTNGNLTLTNSLVGAVVALGVNNNNTVTTFRQQGGTVTLDRVLDIRGRKSAYILEGGTLNCLGNSQCREGNTDDLNRLVVAAGVANLGNFEVHRTASGGGLIVSNGVVNATAIRVGVANSSGYATIWGGAVTNSGLFTICDRSNGAIGATDRRARLLIRGGTVVSTGSGGIFIANQSNLGVGGTAAAIAGLLDINAGTLVAEGLTLVKDNTLTNAHAQFNLSGSGIVYLGALGLTANVGPVNTSYAISLNGGTLAAKDHFSANANMSVAGTATAFQAADGGGNPFNITLNGVVSGSGALNKTGGGTLSLQANNTYSGVTTINGGTLALGAAGAIPNTPAIAVGSGSVFDVTAVGGFTLGNAKTLSGAGTVQGDLTVASGGTINPGSNTVTGTLTISGALNQSGGAVNHFDLPNSPGPSNDRLTVSGDLNVSGVNTLEVVGGGSPGNVHVLIQYGGTFNGALANFTLNGASGVLTNDTVNKTIGFIVTTLVRSPASVVWLGNATFNDWDVINRTNWSNGGVLDYFVTGDNVLFDAIGVVNPNVNIVGNVAPASVTIGAAGNYTFGGTGSITGTGGLIKTNTGTLTINTVNAYSGPTLISNGVVEVAIIANGNQNSSLGASDNSAANLVVNGATLNYVGATASTDRSGIIGDNGATLGVTDSGATLTVSGGLSGTGKLTKSGAGTLLLSPANTYAGGTVINAGTLQFNNAAGAGAGGVTNNGATLRLNGQIVLNNTFEFNGNCNLQLSGVGGGNVCPRGSWTGSGYVTATFLTQNAAQVLTIGGQGNNGGHMWDFSGTVDFGANDGFLRINNDNSNFNFGSSNATFNVGTGTATLHQRNGGTTTHFGALIGGPNTKLAGRGGTGTSGTTTYAIGGKNLTTTFAGEINNGSGTTAINKVGTGTLILSGASIHTGATTVETGTLQINGSFSASPVTVVGGTLAGNGSIGGAVVVNSGGTLSPGTSVGQLTMTSSLQLDFGSTNFFEIDKANATNDAVVGLSSVSYGGDLIVVNLGGTLAAGDTFVLFNATPGNYAGAFNSITLPALSSGLVWDTNNLTVDGSISVTGPTLNVVNNGNNLDFSWTGTFKLQSQTNSLGVGLGNNWSDYPGGSSSPVTVPVDPTAPAVFFRLSSP